MNKKQFITEVSERTGIAQNTTGVILDGILETIGDILAKGESVQFVGFGSFELRRREARSGINPATGESIAISASNIPAFKAGKRLKEKLNR